PTDLARRHYGTCRPVPPAKQPKRHRTTARLSVAASPAASRRPVLQETGSRQQRGSAGQSEPDTAPRKAGQPSSHASGRADRCVLSQGDPAGNGGRQRNRPARRRRPNAAQQSAPCPAGPIRPDPGTEQPLQGPQDKPQRTPGHLDGRQATRPRPEPRKTKSGRRG